MIALDSLLRNCMQNPSNFNILNQIAKKEIPNTDVRNVFIEGSPEKYEIAKKLIEEIIAEVIQLILNVATIFETKFFSLR